MTGFGLGPVGPVPPSPTLLEYGGFLRQSEELSGQESLRSLRGGSPTRSRLVVALGVAAIALLLVAFIGPWWVVNSSGTLLALPFAGTREYGPFGFTVTGRGPYPNATVSNASGYQDSPRVGGVFLVATALTALGLLWGEGMTVVGYLANATRRQRTWGALLGLLAFGYLLAAVLYVMAMLPGAVNEAGGSTTAPFSAFWGSFSYTSFSWALTYTYGAGWAWYAVLAAAVLCLAGGIALIWSRRHATPAGTGAKTERTT